MDPNLPSLPPSPYVSAANIQPCLLMHASPDPQRPESVSQVCHRHLHTLHRSFICCWKLQWPLGSCLCAFTLHSYSRV